VSRVLKVVVEPAQKNLFRRQIQEIFIFLGEYKDEGRHGAERSTAAMTRTTTKKKAADKKN
jgi:hypothetical protein